VAPFKKGPDYIDPFWHSEAAGAPCHNLDPYLMGREQVLSSFGYYGRGYDAAVVEGNRGLFDGMTAAGSFSTAELAKLLTSPVVLAIDCSMTSRTVAALVLGCKQFDPEMNLAGVILNPVANARQEKLIRQVIADYTGLPVLGAVPRLALNMPERHMGLVPPQEHQAVAGALQLAARSVAAHVDVDALWDLMASAPELADTQPPEGLFPKTPPSGDSPVIGVVRDAAFGFYYPENLEALANHGAELVFCSALHDHDLPKVDALYIGGGFPETHAAELAANQAFRDAVRKAARQGLPIYAECGGLMYLGETIIISGEKHSMAGVFPVDFAMQKKPQGHGYTKCTVVGENPFMPVGYQFNAHEFHYSQPSLAPGFEPCFAYSIDRGKGILGSGGGLMLQGVLGTYHHVHCLGAAKWAPGLVSAAKAGHKVA
jgi:cobyrinic acid a,c-diamide synthase